MRPLDKRAKLDFFVPPRDRSPERLGVTDGDLVAARIVSYPTRMESGVVTIERPWRAARPERGWTSAT